MAVTEITISASSLSEANFGYLSIFTLAYSCAYFIFALPFQLLVFRMKSIGRFSIISLFIYILGSFLAYFIITIPNFSLDMSYFMELSTITRITVTGFIFWLCDSIFIDYKNRIR